MEKKTFKQLYNEVPKTPSPKAMFVSEVAKLTHKKAPVSQLGI